MKITSIIYINLKKNWHRRLFIKSLLASSTYKVSRCEGVKYNYESRYDYYVNKGVAPYLSMDRANGVIGCWIAHSHALEMITVEDGVTVIIEDDFICQMNFFETALKMINNFDQDFDAILFDTWGSGPLEVHKISENIYDTRNHSYPFYGGTHCLFINNAKISKILNIKHNSQVKDYDGFLLGSVDIKTFVFYTGQSANRNVGSDINNVISYDVTSIFINFLPPRLREMTNTYKKAFISVSAKKSIPIDIVKMKSIEGFYEVYSNLFVQFCLKKDCLTMIQPWDNVEIFFLPLSETEFICKELPIHIKFSKDESGEVKDVLVSNVSLYKKHNDYKPPIRKAIKLSKLELNSFEGRYESLKVKNFSVNISSTDEYLIVKQMWDDKELIFLPESELAFFLKDYPSMTIKFEKNKENKISQIILADKDTLEKNNV